MITIEELTKTQIILLVLFVSFVTSIATGIITTSLLKETPPSITQVINRVVERTVETVVPGRVPDQATEPQLSAEQRQLVAFLANASRAMVEIRDSMFATSTPLIGVVVSNGGLVVASNTGVATSSAYVATLADRSLIPLSLVSIDDGKGIAIFKFIAEDEGVDGEVVGE